MIVVPPASRCRRTGRSGSSTTTGTNFILKKCENMSSSSSSSSLICNAGDSHRQPGAFYDHREVDRTGRGPISWALSLKRELNVEKRGGEEEEEEKVRMMIERSKEVAMRYENLETRIRKHLKSYFEEDYVKIASLCAVEQWLGDVRGNIRESMRKRCDMISAFECLVAGAYWSTSEFLDVNCEERSTALTRLICVAWETVLLDLFPNHSSTAPFFEDGLALGFAHIKKLTSSRVGYANKSSVESLMRCCLGSSETHSCNDYAESSESLETLAILYNTKYRLRERRERQRPGEWFQIGIPGPEAALDCADYEIGGRRETWTKAILPNGGYVYRRPARYALRSVNMNLPSLVVETQTKKRKRSSGLF